MRLKNRSSASSRGWGGGLAGALGGQGKARVRGRSSGKPPLTAALGFAHSHPSPAEYVEVLQELQRLESPALPAALLHEVLGAATTDYNNNVSPPTPSPPAPPDGAGRSVGPVPQKMSSSAEQLP